MEDYVWPSGLIGLGLGQALPPTPLQIHGKTDLESSLPYGEPMVPGT